MKKKTKLIIGMIFFIIIVIMGVYFYHTPTSKMSIQSQSLSQSHSHSLILPAYISIIKDTGSLTINQGLPESCKVSISAEINGVEYTAEQLTEFVLNYNRTNEDGDNINFDFSFIPSEDDTPIDTNNFHPIITTEGCNDNYYRFSFSDIMNPVEVDGKNQSWEIQNIQQTETGKRIYLGFKPIPVYDENGTLIPPGTGAIPAPCDIDIDPNCVPTIDPTLRLNDRLMFDPTIRLLFTECTADLTSKQTITLEPIFQSKWDLSLIPAGSNITNVTLCLWAFNKTGAGNQNFTIIKIQDQAWDENSAAGFMNGQIKSNITYQFANPALNAYTCFNVTQQFNASWISGEKNLSIRVQSFPWTNEDISGYYDNIGLWVGNNTNTTIGFEDRENSNGTGNQPYMDVQYIGSAVSYLEFSGCQNLLNANTEYRQIQNINQKGIGDCIVVSAQNITVDCQGHSITSIQNYTGIYSNQLNTTIKNCNISVGTGNNTNSIGIKMTDAADFSTVINNTISDVNGYGMYRGIDWSTGNNGPDNSLMSNNSVNVSCVNCIGVYLYSSSTNVLTSNIIYSNRSVGLYLLSSSNNNLTNNIVTSPSNIGIYIYNNANGNILNNNNATSVSSYGIYLNSANNNTLTSNTGTSNSSTGIILSSNANNNTLTSNTGTSNSNFGLYLNSGTNNLYINNTFISNSGTAVAMNTGLNTYIGNNMTSYATSGSNGGLYWTSGGSNIFINNSIYSIGRWGVYTQTTNNVFDRNVIFGFPAIGIAGIGGNNITNNYLSSTSSNGFNLQLNSNNNILINNTITSNSTYAVSLMESNNNIFINNNITGGSYGIAFRNSNNTIVQDCINITGASGDVLYYSGTSINNTFINCSYRITGTNETVMAGGSLIRKWYYRAYVNDTSGNAISGANLNATNVTGSQGFYILTNETGWTNITTITEYVNNGTRLYSNPYNITVNATGYNNFVNTSYNVTVMLNNLNHVITLTSSGAVDTTYPTFSTYYDNNATLIENGTGLFNVTVTNTNGTVWLDINNTNITATNLTSNVYNVSYIFVGHSNNTYTYRWWSYGNGTSHNINNSGARSYTVNASAIPVADTIYPLFDNYNVTPANNSNYSQGAIYRFNVTITNTNTTSGIEFNGTNYTLTNTNLSSYVYNFSRTDLGVGVYNYYWWALGNGSSNLFNKSLTQSYTIAKSTGIINGTINGTQNNFTTQNGTGVMNINLNATNITGVGNCRIWVNGTLYNSGVCPVYNVTNLSIGLYNITFGYDGNTNYTGVNQTWWVNIASPPANNYPTFSNNITTPVNGTMYAPNVIYKFNITITDSNGTVGIEFNGTNYTLTNTNLSSYVYNFSRTDLGVGVYNYYYWSYGNGSSTYYNTSLSYSYTIIQNTSAVIYTYLNNTRANITINNITSIWLNGTIFNVSGNVNLYDNGTLIGNDTNKIGNFTNFTRAVGLYNITAIYNGNLNYSRAYETWYVNVIGFNPTDTIPPYFTFIPNPLSISYPNDFNVTFNATDETAFGYYSINWTTLFAINQSGYLNNTARLGVGNYYINVTINDSSGNKNSTIYNINVTQNTTYVLALAITPAQSVVYPTQTTTTGSGCPSEIVCNLTRNNTGIVTNPEVITLGVGKYNYTYNTTGNTNYSAMSVSKILTVTQNTSAVLYTYLNNTRANITIFNNTAIWLNATLFNVSGTINLYNNGTLINSGTSPMYNLTSFNSTGLYNITAIYLGNTNYSGSYETWWVNVTTAPVVCNQNLQNTSWSDWTNITCLSDNTMNQSRNLTQYDANNCGYVNQTFFEYRHTEYCKFDTTPPVFTNLRNFTQFANQSFSQSITATDNVAVDSYTLNDTANFIINKNTGLITNATNLSNIKIYWLNISVNDTSNNLASGIFYINITGIGASKCGTTYNLLKIPMLNNRVYIKLCELLDFR